MSQSNMGVLEKKRELCIKVVAEASGRKRNGFGRKWQKCVEMCCPIW